MKKAIYFILSILIILGLHLTIRYFINEAYISKYEDGEYQNKSLKILKIINYPESYVIHYNEGNNYYQKESYEKAVSSYKEALRTVPKSRVCKVRTNLALAKLELIEYEDNDNLRNELVEVEEILLEDKCATEDDNGKNKSSQELYNEIEELLNSQGGKEDPKEDPNKDPNEEPNNKKQKEQDIEEKLKQQQKEAAKNRGEIYPREPYEYYDGKNW